MFLPEEIRGFVIFHCEKSVRIYRIGEMTSFIVCGALDGTSAMPECHQRVFSEIKTETVWKWQSGVTFRPRYNSSQV